MTWDKTERRMNCTFCPDHNDLCKNIAVIIEKMTQFEISHKEIKTGQRQIFGAIIVSVLIFILTLGIYKEKVDRLVASHPDKVAMAAENGR